MKISYIRSGIIQGEQYYQYFILIATNQVHTYNQSSIFWPKVQVELRYYYEIFHHFSKSLSNAPVYVPLI